MSTPAHVHLVCRGCERVFEADPALFDDMVARLEREHGFAADLGHLTVFGECRDCTHSQPT
jgi:Fur family ferric uptake transcriptional regulator